MVVFTGKSANFLSGKPLNWGVVYPFIQGVTRYFQSDYPHILESPQYYWLSCVAATQIRDNGKYGRITSLKPPGSIAIGVPVLVLDGCRLVV